MRPTQAFANTVDTTPRKSVSDQQVTPPSDRSSNTPSTFFLAREIDCSQSISDRADPPRSIPGTVPTLEEFLEDDEPSSKRPRRSVTEGDRSSSRRRSTIRPIQYTHSRRASAYETITQEPIERSVTPSPLPSTAASLPDSPKALSSRSVPKSDDELVSDDASSQAIVSSEDDSENHPPHIVQDSQPELIMPSIKMPSRRPFTQRGKQLGKFKILVAGRKGTGKTSLIKSIVQLCEDIVHVDPLSTSHTDKPGLPVETYASTRAYPAWWSDLEESRILRRRKSMGDSVLERNLCFVDTAGSKKLDHIIHYSEQQLIKALDATSAGQHDFASMLSGRGGSQVDVILYLISKDNINDDMERIRTLSRLANVIPLIAQSDLLAPAERQSLKDDIDISLSALPRLPPFATPDRETTIVATAPYAIASVNGPDLDNMDASLLMSPEYVQPLLPSELSVLVDNLFDLDTVAYLKHTSAKKLLSWHGTNPKLARTPSVSTAGSLHNSTLASPQLTSMSNSGVLIPQGSELSLNTSNSYALARVADHSQREERIAQIRLSKWASELQLSLQRERERYERLARHERALWLLQKMGEEVQDGHIVTSDPTSAQAVVRRGDAEKSPVRTEATYQMHDPLGLLQWRHAVRSRGWVALQVVGSVGVLGALAFWLAKTRGITSALNDWAHEWGSWLGLDY